MRRSIQLLGLLLISFFVGSAQEEEAISDDQLAKQAQNPIANLISLPLQNNTNFGMGPFDRSQNVLNIQPVIPVNISENWLLINRAIIPLISQPDFTASSGSEFGLGDIAYQGFFTPVSDSNVTFGFGPVFSFPTATVESLQTKKFSLGPTVVLFASLGQWTAGFTVYNAWSVAGSSSTPDVSGGLLQYFVNYNLANAWYLTSAPIITFNWNAPEGDEFVVPFGGGVGKIFAIGKQKFNGQVAAYYNAVKIESLDGPDWQLRFQLNFLFPR